MTDRRRLPNGGHVDRTRRLRFLFNGRRYEGHPGDTLASALLANDVSVVGRSILWHRPRGLMAAGADEPNALVQVGVTPRSTPDVKATEVDLCDGLVATSVNGWPGIGFDLGVLSGVLGGLLAPGVLNSLALPDGLRRRLIVPALRRIAGWGELPEVADRDRYDHEAEEADVVIAGGGPAGLMAALEAARGGLRVALIDEGATFGGALLHLGCKVGGHEGADWAAETVAALRAFPLVRLLSRTRLIDVDGTGIVRAVERRTDHLGPQIGSRVSRQRLWRLKAGRVILATGAWEQLPAFAGNDRPGVMLAGAVLAYLRRWAVLPGQEAVIFTGDDSAYETALALREAGCRVPVVVDARADPDGPMVAEARSRGIEVLAGHAIVATGGLRHVRSVRVRRLSEDGRRVEGPARVYRCDLLAVCGGWAPDVAPWQAAGGTVVWDPALAAPVPAGELDRLHTIGGCAGAVGLGAALAAGLTAGRMAARDLGGAPQDDPGPTCVVPEYGEGRPLGLVPAGRAPGWGRQKAFVDAQQDVVAADLLLAVRQGLGDPASVSRYTGWAHGTDHGRTGQATGLRMLAEATGRTGVLAGQGPLRPVAFGVLAGTGTGPVRRTTPLHDWHEASGAIMVLHGDWWRPRAYPLPGEAEHHAVEREVTGVRERVGLFDASTLGKIEVNGPDAAAFLDRVYANRWRGVGIGRVRYGLMLDDDGHVLDDGTCARLDEHRWLMTTTTSRAVDVQDHLMRRLRGPWRDMAVVLTPVTEQWATLTLAGPRSKDVLARLAPDLYLGTRAFPFMTVQDAAVGGVPARVARIGFTGALTYEVSVPRSRALAVWQAMLDAGTSFGITPVGLSALETLRTEKGVILTGHETDGTVTPYDLGYGRLVALDKPDFVGREALARLDPAASGRWHLVGLLTEDPRVVLPDGAALAAVRGTAAPRDVIGRVSSSCYSPTLGRSIALGLVADGRARFGEAIHAPLVDRWVTATIAAPVFYDPEGRTRDG